MIYKKCQKSQREHLKMDIELNVNNAEMKQQLISLLCHTDHHIGPAKIDKNTYMYDYFSLHFDVMSVTSPATLVIRGGEKYVAVVTSVVFDMEDGMDKMLRTLINQVPNLNTVVGIYEVMPLENNKVKFRYFVCPTESTYKSRNEEKFQQLKEMTKNGTEPSGDKL